MASSSNAAGNTAPPQASSEPRRAFGPAQRVLLPSQGGLRYFLKTPEYIMVDPDQTPEKEHVHASLAIYREGYQPLGIRMTRLPAALQPGSAKEEASTPEVSEQTGYAGEQASSNEGSGKAE